MQMADDPATVQDELTAPDEDDGREVVDALDAAGYFSEPEPAHWYFIWPMKFPEGVLS